MLNDITIVECEVMSHLVRLRGKDTVQRAHCAVTVTSPLNEGPVQQFVLLSVLSSETMNEMQEEEEDKKEEEEEVEKQ